MASQVLLSGWSNSPLARHVRWKVEAPSDVPVTEKPGLHVYVTDSAKSTLVGSPEVVATADAMLGVGPQLTGWQEMGEPPTHCHWLLAHSRARAVPR